MATKKKNKKKKEKQCGDSYLGGQTVTGLYWPDNRGEEEKGGRLLLHVCTQDELKVSLQSKGSISLVEKQIFLDSLATWGQWNKASNTTVAFKNS